MTAAILRALVALVVTVSVCQAQPLRQTLRNRSHTAIVRFDNDNKVIVDLSRDERDNPRSVFLTVYNKNHGATELELKSQPPPEGESKEDLSGVTRYAGTISANRAPAQGSGELSPDRQSIVGLELRIPLPHGAPEILH